LSATSAGLQESLRQQLVSQAPFALLSEAGAQALMDAALLRRFPVGARLLRSDELPAEVLLVLSGEVRLLVSQASDQITLCKRGPGQLLGWSSVLRAEPCELVQASSDVTLIAFPAAAFVGLIRQEPAFAAYFGQLAGLQEAHAVALAAAGLHPRLAAGWDADLLERSQAARALSLAAGAPFTPPQLAGAELDWFLSSLGVPDHPVGRLLEPGQVLPARPGFVLPYRLIGLPRTPALPASEQVVPVAAEALPSTETRSTNLESLGILEDDHLVDGDRFPSVRGRGQLAEALAVAEMVALQQRVPFRRDAIAKVLEDPEFKEWYTAQGLVPTLMPAAEYETFINAFAEDQKKFLIEYGILQQ
jgi:ATP-binding cassette subfamily B protein